MKLSKLLLSTSLVMIVAANPVYAQNHVAKTKAAAPATTTAAKPGNDLGILATIAAIDKSEIIVSVIAINKKVNSDVTDFAKMMVDQHGDNLNQILEMLPSMHANALTSSDAEKIVAQNKKGLIALGALKGDEFAKAYADAMVKGHQGALDLIDHHLKTAQSEQVKKFLTDTRTVVAEHLEHAKKLQEEVK